MNYVFKSFKENPLPYALTLGSILLAVINLIITSQLAPVASSLSSLSQRVNGVEKTLNERTPIVERFIILEARDALLVEDVKTIKEDIKKLLLVHRIQQ